MPNQHKDDPNKPGQKGAPQDTQNMPSSGNSPDVTGATTGTDEGETGGRDVERSGGGGAATGTQRASDQTGTNATGDPGRTPGKAEGVEDPGKRGNE
jgi:hypothetical protein